MTKDCKDAAGCRLASAGIRGSCRQSGFVFMPKYLHVEEDEGDNMLPKAQPGQTLFNSLACHHLNGCKTNLPGGKTMQHLWIYLP